MMTSKTFMIYIFTHESQYLKTTLKMKFKIKKKKSKFTNNFDEEYH